MSTALAIPRIVVAATASGSGKTTIVSGLIAAFRARGLTVQPFKCGPDYIDPGYHSEAAGRPCRNLDSWMLDDSAVLASFMRACRGADLAIVEGVMGLFDGCDYLDDHASAAQIARLLGAPVLLVHDISGAARSVAATVSGFASFGPATRIGGVLFNFAGSESHAQGCASAVTDRTRIPVLGWLPRDDRLRIPERHLGLVLGGERSSTSALVESFGREVSARFDLDAILRIARDTRPIPVPARCPEPQPAGPAPLLAVARDEALSFYYPDNIELLEEAAARIAYFSPVRGETPPPDTAGVYLGGGYPELHADALSSNTRLWDRLRELHACGAPILAECGGFMVLAEAIVDKAGNTWPMAGLVPGVVRMNDRIAGLGYRQVTAASDNLLADKGDTLRGHEFHYSSWEQPEGAGHPAWLVQSTASEPVGTPLGFAKNGLLASYLHIHLGQKTGLATRLVSMLRH